MSQNWCIINWSTVYLHFLSFYLILFSCSSILSRVPCYIWLSCPLQPFPVMAVSHAFFVFDVLDTLEKYWSGDFRMFLNQCFDHECSGVMCFEGTFEKCGAMFITSVTGCVYHQEPSLLLLTWPPGQENVCQVFHHKLTFIHLSILCSLEGTHHIRRRATHRRW